jgi:hypothetical protein
MSLEFAGGRYRECFHISRCRICRAENVEIHETAVTVRSWVDAIADLSRRVGEEETIDAAMPLLDAIGALACAIGQRAEVEIEDETLAPAPAPRGPKRVPTPEPVPAPSLDAGGSSSAGQEGGQK